jgi:hypothetical protein
MAITSLTVETLAAGAWEYAWAGTAPFDVYRDGAQILDQTTRTALVVEGGDPYEPPALEVRDANDTGLAESVEYAPCLTFQWRGTANAEYYLIQQYSGGGWVTRKVLMESGRGYYQDTTGPLADATTHEWRVIAVDSQGGESQPLELDVLLVRNPPPPSIGITYNSGTGQITVAAR